MSAPKQNQFWRARGTHGPALKFPTPAALEDACDKYFEWVDQHPIYETQIFSYQGVVKRVRVPKMRAMTLTGLFTFLGISPSTWANYRQRGAFADVTDRAEAIIYVWKFEGAATGLLDANLIARELGVRNERKRVSSVAEKATALMRAINGRTGTTEQRI